MAFIRNKRKLRLRILGMHEEGGAPIDIGAQQAQAFVGRVPRLDHDEVQFVAQEIFDHALVARFDFKEIGEHSGGSVSSLHGARLKEPPHRLGGITVLGDDRFERSLLAERGGVFGTEGIEMLLGFVLSRAFVLDRSRAGSRSLLPGRLRVGKRFRIPEQSGRVVRRKLSDCDEAVAISARSRCSSRPMPASRSSDCVSWLRRLDAAPTASRIAARCDSCSLFEQS